MPGTKFLNNHSSYQGGRMASSQQDWDFDEPSDGSDPNYWNPGFQQNTYDDWGQLTDNWSEKYSWTYSGGGGYDNADKVTTYRSRSQSYYAADGKLRVHQIMRDSVDYRSEPTLYYGNPWGAYEEYWYDALGRRVLKRSRQSSPVCTYAGRCYSSITRFVWDGNQILWEVRQADGSNKDIENPSGGSQTGNIGYVHAGGIDAPLGMVRNGSTVVLHRNWRGLYAFATDENGDQVTCAPQSFSGCDDVSWPGGTWNLQRGHIDPHATQTWYGSVSMGHQDRTGLVYQRNRYYDSSTGQFTRQDPIGIAGGLNLYGYANGDPVNFHDPFGLDCEERDEPGTQAMSKECDEDWTSVFTGGVSGLAHLYSIAMGFGASAGVTDDFQFFFEVSGSASLGLGLFVGGAAEGGVGVRRGDLPVGTSMEATGIAQGNIGAGAAAGGTVTASPSGGGVRFSPRGGVGYGAQLSIGVQGTYRASSRSYAREARALKTMISAGIGAIVQNGYCRLVGC